MSRSETAEPAPLERVETGIAGLDEILGGGLPQGHLYLIEGDAGAGKSTVGLHFLMEGRRRGERTLWITLSETARELEEAARSHGWALEGIELCNLVASQQVMKPEEKYSFFSPADVELDDITKAVVTTVERVRPSRVVFDPFSDIRHLARDVLRYRRQLLALREFFAEKGCTVLLMQELTRGTPGDIQAEALVHGYLTMHQESPEYGGQRRRLRVHKMAASPSATGSTTSRSRPGASRSTPGSSPPTTPPRTPVRRPRRRSPPACPPSTPSWAVASSAARAC